MPKIYEYLGLIFYFYSNEHEPIHVHVTKAERESVFEIILENGQLFEIKKRKAHSKIALTSKEEKEAVIFIREYHKKISKGFEIKCSNLMKLFCSFSRRKIFE
jgi:hypothetical protein